MRVCCVATFSSVLSAMDFIDGPMAAVLDGRFIICANWITRMPSIVFDVHNVGVGCINQVCNISVNC